VKQAFYRPDALPDAKEYLYVKNQTPDAVNSHTQDRQTPVVNNACGLQLAQGCCVINSMVNRIRTMDLIVTERTL